MLRSSVLNMTLASSGTWPRLSPNPAADRTTSRSTPWRVMPSTTFLVPAVRVVLSRRFLLPSATITASWPTILPILRWPQAGPSERQPQKYAGFDVRLF